MWEYKILKLNIYDILELGNKIENELNKLGRDKWELVTSLPHISSGILGTGGGTSFVNLIFKRVIN